MEKNGIRYKYPNQKGERVCIILTGFIGPILGPRPTASWTSTWTTRSTLPDPDHLYGGRGFPISNQLKLLNLKSVLKYP